MKPSESLLEYALHEIRTRIQNGEYPPGTKLSTQEISDSLGISRTPVISAINRLVSQGLVEAMPRRGMAVANMSPEQITDALEVRKMMELYAVRPALRTVGLHPESLNDMKALLYHFQTAYGHSDLHAEEVEYAFHTKFMELAGNKQLLELYKTNWCVAAIFYFFFRTNQPEHHREMTLRHHVQMLEALESRDEQALSAVVQTHVDSCYDLLDLYRSFNSAK